MSCRAPKTVLDFFKPRAGAGTQPKTGRPKPKPAVKEEHISLLSDSDESPPPSKRARSDTAVGLNGTQDQALKQEPTASKQPEDSKAVTGSAGQPTPLLVDDTKPEGKAAEGSRRPGSPLSEGGRLNQLGGRKPAVPKGGSLLDMVCP